MSGVADLDCSFLDVDEDSNEENSDDEGPIAQLQASLMSSEDNALDLEIQEPEDDLEVDHTVMEEFQDQRNEELPVQPTTVTEDMVDGEVFDQVPNKRLLADGYERQLESGMSAADEDLLADQLFVCSLSKCKELFNGKYREQLCQICGADVLTDHFFVGGTLVLRQKCCIKPRHVQNSWQSSHKDTGIYTTNLLLMASITMTGNSYAKVAHLAKFMNLVIPSASTFHRVQDAYVTPAVNRYYDFAHGIIIESLAKQGQPLDLCGDGRCDSPGFSAKYLQYSFMDAASSYIVHLTTTDKREVGLKSPNMERHAAILGLAYLCGKVGINSFTTDDHRPTRVLLEGSQRSETKLKALFPQLEDTDVQNILKVMHYLDVWHRSKKIGTALVELAKKARHQELLVWVKPIVNHFWFSCGTCKGDQDVIKELWLSVLYHMQGIHEWSTGQCTHGTVDEERPPIKSESTIQAVREVVMLEKLLQDLKMYVGFHHTGLLENFNGLINMYASKRNHFEYSTMVARTRLAAIDHNHHIHREIATSNGKSVVTKAYSKGGAQWVLRFKKEPKNYSYHRTLKFMVLEERRHYPSRLSAKHVIDESDPRNIAPNIAPVQGVSTEQLLDNYKSRMGKSAVSRNEDEVNEEQPGEQLVLE
ncbi:uncharacterized protein LOC135498899 [Lineus longissimus]